MPNVELRSYRRVAIVGVGLIGGSIGLGLLSRKIACSVVGIGRSPDRLKMAVDVGAITEFSTDIDAVSDADIVVICTPVNSIADFVVSVAKLAPEHVLITDGGSTKRTIVEDVESRLAERNVFVGSHPMAGSEKTGVEFAESDLYENRDVILTPTAQTDVSRVDQCRRFWESLGANVRTMSPGEHDDVVSSISHAPHVVAAILSASTPDSHLSLASTGWCDTTRIAAGDVMMWEQIVQQNKSSVQKSLQHFQAVLQQFTDALASDDFESVRKLLAKGKSKRDAVAS
ncbi:MAG: prephenate dehydrogenase/arogenate dehydrogenase family protein [Planctomycetales bacterium]|nr:prephenate dehydrogenase/arogenate dehydrogenase family protein [Planctomycetales bacterium]